MTPASVDAAAWLDAIAVRRRFSISRATLERRVRDGTFPRPAKLGRLRLWKLAELERLEARLLADRVMP